MYRTDLDVIKGISIIAVVLFHMGLLKTGYLGVDAFFVINGFLVIPSVYEGILENRFSFIGFMVKRTVRLLPLIVLASALSLVLGYFLMMPDHYENLSQSVIAACAMSTNILSSITTRNYWNMVNDYKPLMHLWYVGILFEFYIVVPMILLTANKIARICNVDRASCMKADLGALTTLSFILFLSPNSIVGDKFYLLTTRFFEIGLGGIMCLYSSNLKLNWGGV